MGKGGEDLPVSTLGGLVKNIIFKKEVRVYNVSGIFKASGHYSHVTVLPNLEGYFLELSGMLGFDREKLADDAKFRALRALENIEKIIVAIAEAYQIEDFHKTGALSHVTSSRADIVNLSQNSALVDEAYVMYFMPKVARTMTGVQELPLNALVQITARAYLKR